MIPAMTAAQIVGALLIFARVLGIFTSAPVFGHAHLPPQVKIPFAAIISLILLPLLHLPDPRLADNLLLLIAAVVKEAAVGLIIGWIATLVFMAIQLAGEAADIQIGFGLANIVDPLLGNHTAVLGQFQYMISTLLFLVLNGHHWVLSALVKSFDLVPLNDVAFQTALSGRVIDIVSNLFIIGLRIGGPVILAVFMTDLALGLVGRTVPQMNLMMTGLPIKMFVGFAVLLVSIPFFLVICQELFTGMYRDIITILQVM